MPAGSGATAAGFAADASAGAFTAGAAAVAGFAATGAGRLPSGRVVLYCKSGVRSAAVAVEIQQGSVTETGGTLDLAIEGEGYLEVALPNGDPAYTRDGALKRNGDGLIVTADGFAVAGDITIPEDAKDVTINSAGEVYAYFNGQTQAQLLGQFNLTTFVNAQGLEAMGSNLFKETEASGTPNVGEAGEDGRGTFRQGYLEASSVDAVREITGLIEAQRGYEMNAKVITAADEMLAATVQIR